MSFATYPTTILFIVLSAVLTWGQQPAPEAKKKLQLGQFDASMLDKDVDPCNDFYAYACNKWRAQNPIPEDRSSWGRFDELAERGEHVIRGILDKYSDADSSRTPVEQKIGDYYHACMDENTIEQAGARPLEQELRAIESLQSMEEFAREVAHLHRQKIEVLFSFGIDQDFKDATSVMAQAGNGGMALPDREFYLSTERNAVDLRSRYLDHLRTMFELLGDSAPVASAEAIAVMRIEAGLAQGTLDSERRLYLAKMYHKMAPRELTALSSNFIWASYWQAIGVSDLKAVNVIEPDFFKQLNALLVSVPLQDWKSYLRWHVLHASAALLSSAFVNETVYFFDKVLTGRGGVAPRWRRCVRYTTSDLGDAVGQEYVERSFGAEGKERSLKMAQSLEKALANDIQSVPWLGQETRQRALQKLTALTNRVGYPDKWRDYSNLKITRDDALGNSMRANEFDFQRQIEKIGKPTDKGAWPYPASTANASYNPQQNNITFPAGVLQPPFYDNAADDALNFGAIGGVMGHELTHGFDDEGNQFDDQGNLRDWWTRKDKKEFERRTKCLVDQYSGYRVMGKVKVNGRTTLGENVADNAGLRLAYMALMDTLAGKTTTPIDGLTKQQRFFIGWANVWCQNRTDEWARALAEIDPHVPGQWRVNGVVSNMPEFREAFHCQAGAPMVREKACRVW